jgi:hypothetical protein
LRGQRIQKIDIVFPDRYSGIKISLTERWSSAATPIFCERHLKTERFQHFHGSDSNMWFVIAHERVVPQNHFATLL